MSHELLYWHTLIVDYGSHALFLNNDISRFELAFRCYCCSGNISYSTMKCIGNSYTLNPCFAKFSNFLTKQYINILYRILVSNSYFKITILLIVMITIMVTKTIMKISFTVMMHMINQTNGIIFCVIHAMTFLTILLALQIKNQAYPLFT